MYRTPNAILVFLVLTLPNYGFGADKSVGEARYNESCVNCHGQAGKGAASYPKVSGNDVEYTMEKLKAYREGIKQGPNSSLMIMMAKPLTDEEIVNLAAYLEDATYGTK
ncbi:MAG: c-type cytochrome [Roseobacter sp.]|uniref:c-type cytochrome n=1 Tax=Tateyamaria sp. TaxID=1929288 RepID=UPI0032748767